MRTKDVMDATESKLWQFQLRWQLCLHIPLKHLGHWKGPQGRFVPMF